MMKENKNTEHLLTEEELQQVAGGTGEDARRWLQNLPEEHRKLLNAYKGGRVIDETKLAQAKVLNREHARLRDVPEKTLTDGSSASRVGQLRPKK